MINGMELMHGLLRIREKNGLLTNTLHSLFNHYQIGKLPHSGLICRIRKRSIVRLDLGGRKMLSTTSNHLPDREIGIVVDVGFPIDKTFGRSNADSEGGIHDNEAREEIREHYGEREAQDAAPVLIGAEK